MKKEKKVIMIMVVMMMTVVQRFSAQNALGVCRASLVCPEQPGWRNCKRTADVSDMTVVLLDIPVMLGLTQLCLACCCVTATPQG